VALTHRPTVFLWLLWGNFLYPFFGHMVKTTGQFTLRLIKSRGLDRVCVSLPSILLLSAFPLYSSCYPLRLRFVSLLLGPTGPLHQKKNFGTHVPSYPEYFRVLFHRWVRGMWNSIHALFIPHINRSRPHCHYRIHLYTLEYSTVVVFVQSRCCLFIFILQAPPPPHVPHFLSL
jgi:hypothetical protein